MPAFFASPTSSCHNFLSAAPLSTESTSASFFNTNLPILKICARHSGHLNRPAWLTDAEHSLQCTPPQNSDHNRVTVSWLGIASKSHQSGKSGEQMALVKAGQAQAGEPQCREQGHLTVLFGARPSHVRRPDGVAAPAPIGSGVCRRPPVPPIRRRWRHGPLIPALSAVRVVMQ